MEDPPVFGRIRRARDPFWDDGKGARRSQRRTRVESAIALAIAIAACCLTVAMWLRTLAPVVQGLGLG
jgi:hypothetical protein